MIDLSKPVTLTLSVGEMDRLRNIIRANGHTHRKKSQRSIPHHHKDWHRQGAIFAESLVRSINLQFEKQIGTSDFMALELRKDRQHD